MRKVYFGQDIGFRRVEVGWEAWCLKCGRDLGSLVEVKLAGELRKKGVSND